MRVRLESATVQSKMCKPYKLLSQPFRGDFVMNGIGGDLDVTRSTLFKDIFDNFVKSLCPGRIGDWLDLVE